LLRLGTLFTLTWLLSACSYFSFFSTKQGDDAVTIYKQLQEAKENEPATAAAPATTEFPVRVNYAIKTKMLADHDLEIEIEYLALKALPVLKVGYTTSEGLDLITKTSKLRYQDIQQHQLIQHRIVVVPDEENEYYVNIIMVTEDGDVKTGKQVRIPIALGKFSLQQRPKVSETP
jgi:hypothetical protein